MKINDNMKINLSPISLLTYYLTVLMLIGSLSQVETSFDFVFLLRNFLLLFGGGYGVYRIFLLLKKTAVTRFEHRFITSAILFLLFYFDNPWYVFLGVGMGAEVLQRIVRLPTGPLMNPAALITTIATLLGFYPSWWGASFSPRIPLVEGGMSVAALLTIPFGVYVAYKYRKLKIVGGFFAAFTLAYLAFLQTNPLFILIEGTVLFFALVMLVEPKTSPVQLKEQLIYGAAVGLLIPLALKIHFAEPYAGPLILCNLLFNVYRNRKYLFLKLDPRQKVESPPLVNNGTMNH